MNERVILGTGQFGWQRRERVTDRYGAVALFDTGDGPALNLEVFTRIEGQRGHLEAVVIETRQSAHLGDLFRGLFPETPEVGEVIRLCEPGVAFVERGDCGLQVGIRPDDDRKVDWLDPEAMYRCHDQTVRLVFWPEP